MAAGDGFVPGGASSARGSSLGVNLVEVYTSVTDTQGNPMNGLTQADFELRENGELQTIANFTAGDFPLSAAIAIDRSFSVAGTKLSLAKAAAQTFLGGAAPRGRSDDHRRRLAGRGGRAAIDRSDAASGQPSRASTRLARPDCTTPSFTRSTTVQPAKGRRALIVLSDGDDRYSHASAVRRSRSRTPLRCDGVSDCDRPHASATLCGAGDADRRTFIAQATDGAALTDTVRAIARELRRQYLLGYTPTRPPVPGSNEWRSIAVTVKKPDAQVRATRWVLVK